MGVFFGRCGQTSLMGHGTSFRIHGAGYEAMAWTAQDRYQSNFMFERARDLDSWCNTAARYRMLLLTPGIRNHSTDYCIEPDGGSGQRFLQNCSAASSKRRIDAVEQNSLH